MQLAERIFVKENQAMADLCTKQTAVYNQALFYLRQEFFYNDGIKEIKIDKNGKEKVVYEGFLSYYDLNDKSMLKWKQCYRDAIPGCAANTIQRCCDNWKGYWKSLKKYNENSSGYTGKPRMPNYTSRNEKSPVYFTYAQFSIKDHHVLFPKAASLQPVHVPRLNDQKIGDTNASVKQIRIIPSINTGFWIECIYNVEEKKSDVNPSNVMGIDLGMHYLATIVDNLGNQPLCINGDIAKIINQWYSKEIARLKADKERSNPRMASLQRKKEENNGLSNEEWIEFRTLLKDTKQMKSITEKRNRRINHLFHQISRFIIDEAIKNHVGIIVIGHNKGQKQAINIGHKNNQVFTHLPLFKFIGMLMYKAAMVGIEVKEITEEFTSKASFIDGDALPDRTTTKKKLNGHSDVHFSGKRAKRGLYITKNGTQIHADVNAAYNILRKGCPEALGRNGAGTRLYPKVVNINPH